MTPGMADLHQMIRNLPAWRPSGLLTHTRTSGHVGFNKNGGALDIWLRIDGRPRWFGINRTDLEAFLASDEECSSLACESDRNAEPDPAAVGS